MALVDLLLTEDTLLEEGLAGGVEGAVEGGDEEKGFGGQDLLGLLGGHLSEDGDTGNL